MLLIKNIYISANIRIETEVIIISFLAAVGSAVLAFLIFFWSLLAEWLKLLFVVPFQNAEVLWIIIPIWLGWFFSEFFQEKHSTSFGNAISNGAIALWVGIDWTRLIVNKLVSHYWTFGWAVLGKFAISAIVLAFGLLIIIQGIKTKKFIHFVGRIREVSYILLVFSPIVYGLVDITWKLVLAIVVFAPIHYWIIEWIDHITPNPKIYDEDEGGKSPDSGLGSLGSPAPPGDGSSFGI